jgi:hypothetical protein
MNAGVKIRRRTGSVLLEGPFALWILFIILFFPLVNLCTICIRSTFLWCATHDATIYAARAMSFQSSVNGQPTAADLAELEAVRTANAFSGVHITNVLTEIVVTNNQTLAQTVQSTPLATPADTSDYSYQIQVAVSGNVDPFMPYVLSWFGTVPGLTKAYPVTFLDRQYCETPQGLNI